MVPSPLTGRLLRFAGLLVVLALAVPASAPAKVSNLTVHGHRLVNPAGKTVQLRGVNRSGSEYACAGDFGFFDGPSNDKSIEAIRSWKANSVRVPLNESCWLDIGNPPKEYSGKRYRKKMTSFINRLMAHGLHPIIDLHISNSPGVSAEQTLAGNGLRPMPNEAHSIDFWRSVANRFQHKRGVVFDLYNEPHDITWKCLRDGCRVREDPLTPSIPPYQAVGMQKLVDVVRAAGAKQPIMIPGLQYSGDLSKWLKWRPHDPAHNLTASFHNYEGPDIGSCHRSCWKRTIAPIAKRFPVITDETGDVDCTHDYIDSYMRWADGRDISYLAWAWDATRYGYWNCKSGPALIFDYDGTPTDSYGKGFRAHLRAVAR